MAMFQVIPVQGSYGSTSARIPGHVHLFKHKKKYLLPEVPFILKAKLLKIKSFHFKNPCFLLYVAHAIKSPIETPEICGNN